MPPPITLPQMLHADMLKRIGPTNPHVFSALGLLGEFTGVWVGTGFNLIARPDKQHKKPFFLQLNTTVETLEFSPIGGEVPNRGSEQDDIFLHGIHYLQRVSDAVTHAALHLEPGFWIHVPPTTEPAQGETYVRQSTIPHGDSLIAQSTFFTAVRGGPVLSKVDSFPFPINEPIPDLNTVPNPKELSGPYVQPYLDTPLPPGLPAGLVAADVIRNPVLLLEAAIQGQDITHTAVIQVSSSPVGGIVNIPFVVRNANTVRLDSIFWIESVKTGPSTSFQQLQYVQRVILDFDGIHWPHISTATLVKQ